MRFSIALISAATTWFPRPSNARSWTIFDTNSGYWGQVERDVCIIGGGASGVHAAVSLHDLNKTVIVVERNNRLGGNTHTWKDPVTGRLVDIGVVIFQPEPVVFKFFEGLGIPYLNSSTTEWNQPGQPANDSLPVAFFQTFRADRDFRDGSIVTRSQSPDTGAALGRLAAAMAPYDYLLHGYEQLPDPVPEDLYQTFGAFVEKYDLHAAVPIVYQVAQGMGDLLHLPTIHVIKYFNSGDIRALSHGYLTHAHGNNSEIYTRAGAVLGDDNILLESSIIATNRDAGSTDSGRMEILVSTRDDGLKLLLCKQILLTIPPELSNLRGWDLTSDEKAVFSQYTTANGYWTGLVRNVGLNETVTTFNSAQDRSYNIPIFPAVYDISPVGTIRDLWWIKVSANNPTLTDAQIQSYAFRQIATIQKSLNATVTEPEWAVFQSHTPFHLQVGAKAIRDGFYKDLTALQGGQNNTMFYSGAAFHTHYSTLLWRYNQDVVIPRMLSRCR